MKLKKIEKHYKNSSFHAFQCFLLDHIAYMCYLKSYVVKFVKICKLNQYNTSMNIYFNKREWI